MWFATPDSTARPGFTLAADVALALITSWIAASILFSHPETLAHYGVSLAHSSDNVAPYVLFDNVFRRGFPISGWMFPEAPFFVPDIALAWIVYALSGSLTAAIGLYAWASGLLFLLLVRAVTRVVGMPAPAWRLWVCSWLLACALGAHAAPTWFSHLFGYVLMPYIHSGTLLAALAGLVLVFGARDSAGWRRIASLMVLCMTMLASDRLFVLQFASPALAICVAIAWRRRSRWHAHAAIGLGIVMVASEAVRWLTAQAFGTDPGDRIPAATSIAVFVRDLKQLAVGDPFGTLLVIVGLLATLATLRSTVTPAMRGFAAFILLSIAAPLAAALVLGRYHSLEEWRYVQSIGLLGVPLAGVIATHVGPYLAVTVHRAAWPAIFAFVIATGWIAGVDRRALAGYAADQEACLRDLAQTNHLHRGIATYWHANEMSARFTHGPLVIPASADLGPRMRTIVDLGWLGVWAERASDLPVIDFVDEDGYAIEALDRAFGAPASRAVCPRSTYRIYRAADGVLGRWFRHADWIPSRLLDSLHRVVVPAAAWPADPRFIDGDALHAVGAFASSQPVLATAFDIPAGDLAVWIDYRLALPSGEGRANWQVATLDDQGTVVSVLGSGALAPSAEPVRFDLAIGTSPAKAHVLGIVVTVQGDADIRIGAVGVGVARSGVGMDARLD